MTPDSPQADPASPPADPGQEALRASYQSVPYSVNAFPQTQPDRLATVARLFGLPSPDPDRCRVLELGCASGGNLIPMAIGSPASTFVGIDLAAGQVADGRRVVEALGLANVDLREGSILDVGPELGQFDYILAHGVFSWVPPAVQEKILRICRENLSPSGVAYISYNTYPGWHARAAVREMLWYHTATVADPAERVRQARALLAFLAGCMPHADGSYGALVRQELMLLLVTPDSYLLHEHLDEFNEPLYFHQFAQRAAQHNLQYLGEAQVGMMAPGRFGEGTEKVLRHLSPDLLHMEQYMDFLRNRMFRQTLLCHADVQLDHAFRPEALHDFHIASLATRVSPGDDGDDENGAVEFATAAGPRLKTRDPLMKSAMTLLNDASPAVIHLPDLLQAARRDSGLTGEDLDAQRQQLSTRLLNCGISGLVEFSVRPSTFTTRISSRPVASPYARLRAKEGGKVVNMRLESVPLDEPTTGLIAKLDGTLDHRTLCDAVQQPGDAVEGLLVHLARSALLIG